MDSEILLRKVKNDDAEFLCSINNNKDLMEIFCDDKSTLEDLNNSIDIWRHDEDEEVYI